MHRWMSTTALDWRGRARGRQVAPSGPRAGSRSARRTPVAQPSLASALSSALPVHLMQWMAAKRCVAVAANAGTTVCTAGTWNSPTAGQALLGTALHRAAAGLRCAIPPRLRYPSNLKWNLEGCAGGGLTGAASCLALPCPGSSPSGRPA
ncbi:hypothetical protein Purlil1_1310 [Purpureocillium lilacinum]|uniref:Uncharacterized protein n=1 Tax=Purpureocillium lilacinum TaxID=33203 RepID=A0ABR0CEH4_PURLI|nr:hypothetical protein Purlil1_1310 [Purpureocillium lilacinum]